MKVNRFILAKKAHALSIKNCSWLFFVLKSLRILYGVKALFVFPIGVAERDALVPAPAHRKVQNLIALARDRARG